MASKADRDARLDKLQQATDTYVGKEVDRLKKEVVLLKRIMKGRTGSERLNNASVQSASDLLVDELTQFLTGE